MWDGFLDVSSSALARTKQSISMLVSDVSSASPNYFHLYSFILQWSFLHQNSKTQTDHKSTPSRHPIANHFKSGRRESKHHLLYCLCCVVLCFDVLAVTSDMLTISRCDSLRPLGISFRLFANNLCDVKYQTWCSVTHIRRETHHQSETFYSLSTFALSSVSFEHMFSMHVLIFTPNHTPLRYRTDIG